ncbi:MAG: hypothetical protein ACREKM_12740, partial [Longimicrobiales bacterium]
MNTHSRVLPGDVASDRTSHADYSNTGHPMLIRRPADIASSDITAESVYLDRRRFLGAAAGGIALATCQRDEGQAQTVGASQEELTPFEAVTTYNNFYEFGTGKEDPSENAHTLKTRPWSIAVEGHVARPAVYDIEDFVKP